MASTFHVAFGDTNINLIRVYPNGTSGSSEVYYRSSYPNGFYYTSYSPTSIAFRCYDTIGATGNYWLWYNISGNNNGTDSSYESSGYANGKNYCLIAHKSGVTGSLTFLTACDNTYLPYQMVTTTPSNTFYFSSSDVYSGSTMPSGTFSASTYFTIYIRTGGGVEVGGSMYGRNLTGSNDINIPSTTDYGYNASKDYVIKCFGEAGVLQVTITPAHDSGIDYAYVNGYTTAQTVTTGSYVTLSCSVKDPVTTYDEINNRLRRRITTYSFDYWEVGGSVYAYTPVSHQANTTATATAYSSQSTATTYAWRMSFASGGGSGSMNAIETGYSSSGSGTIQVPACTFIAPAQDYRFRYWTDGTNIYTVGTNITGTTNITLTAVWVKTIPTFAWTNDDDTYIASGQPSTNISASRWNNALTNIIRDCESMEEKSASTIPSVSQGDQIHYSDFNSIRNALYVLDGWSVLPTNAVAGDPLSAQKFKSLKNGLNQIVNYCNSL